MMQDIDDLKLFVELKREVEKAGDKISFTWLGFTSAEIKRFNRILGRQKHLLADPRFSLYADEDYSSFFSSSCCSA